MRVLSLSSLSSFITIFFVWQELSLPRLPTAEASTSRQDQHQQELLRRKQEMERDFVPAEQLLVERQVPFSPSILMDSNWRQRLRRDLDQIPEMREIRYESKPLKGVQLANTLYLPEYTRLEGDTVILVKHLVFEGRNAVIRGNYNIYVYPVETAGVMGTTLEKWREKRSKDSTPPENASFLAPLPDTPIIERDGNITIDTHGDGFTEWLQEHGGQKGLQQFWSKQPKPKANMSIQGLIDTHGNGGTPGPPNYNVGTTGTNGVPWQGNKGNDGTCGDTTTVNGQKGQGGGDGGTGGKGGQGGTGGRGNDAGGAIAFDIPDDTQNWTFLSYGGDGGPGGPSSAGGPGGPGGTGGPGGDGATCQCSQGGAGNGGQGGEAGWGGKGGPGEKGGKGGGGGDGKDITVTYPCAFTHSIQTDAHGGAVGTGGPGGAGGNGGSPGSPGNGGHPGTNFYCASAIAHSGDFGDNGQSFGAGDAGAVGDPGDTPGGSGGVSVTQRACDNNCDPDGTEQSRCINNGGDWEPVSCTCGPTAACPFCGGGGGSPIIIDVLGDGSI